MALQLPDSISFGKSAHGIIAEKPLFLFNDQQNPMRLTFVATPPFAASPNSIVLQPMGSRQVTVSVAGTDIGPLAGMLSITIAGMPYRDIPLEAECYSADLQLSRPIVDEFPSTLVTQSSMATTEIQNFSEAVSRFQIMALPLPLNDMDDPLFSGTNTPFTIFPEEGTIYPTGISTLSINFIPKVSGMHEATAWVQCTGRKDRIPLKMRAVAAGPEVEFDCDVLNFKSVIVGSLVTGEVTLTNSSDIEVEFHIAPTDADHSISVSYDKVFGVIEPKGSSTLMVSVVPNVLGSFNVPSLWSILGMKSHVLFEIQGRCIPPKVNLHSLSETITEVAVKTIAYRIYTTLPPVDQERFQQDFDEIEQHAVFTKEFMKRFGVSRAKIVDFGACPYSFGCSREIGIVNHSPLPCEFTVTIEPVDYASQEEKQEQLLAAADFHISPTTVALEPHASTQLSVSFVPRRKAGVYKDFHICVYHGSTPAALDRVQLLAQVLNPHFELLPSVFDIPEAYVGLTHTAMITIRNTSQVFGRWSFPPQELLDSCIVECAKTSGVLQPEMSESFECYITPRSAGNIVVPVKFVADSLENQSLSCMIQYVASGPKVVSASEILKFGGGIRVLSLEQRKVTLTNTGLSEARCRLVTAKPGSYFSIDTEENDFALCAGQSRDVTVNFCANELGTFKEQLLIFSSILHPSCDISDEVIKQTSMVTKVGLTASARGTSLYCPSQDLDRNPVVNCGTWFTCEELRHDLRIENHGTTQQSLQWAKAPTPDSFASQVAVASEAFSEPEKKGDTVAARRTKKPDSARVLSFETDRIILQPGDFFVFTLKGRADSLMNGAMETFVLKATPYGKQQAIAFTVTFAFSFIETQISITELIRADALVDSVYTELAKNTSVVEASDKRLERLLLCQSKSTGHKRGVSAQPEALHNTLSAKSPRSDGAAVTELQSIASLAPGDKRQQDILDFVYESFPLLPQNGPPDAFLSQCKHVTDGFMTIEEAMRYVDVDAGVYIRNDTVKYIRLANTSQLQGRVQLIVSEPFRIRNVSKVDAESLFSSAKIRSGEPHGTPPTMSPLGDSTTNQEGQYCQHETILLPAAEQAETATFEISVSDGFIFRELLTQHVDSMLMIRLLPPAQTPDAVPTICLPLSLDLLYPHLDFHCVTPDAILRASNNLDEAFRSASEAPQQESGNVISFGNTNVGTTLTQTILCRNMSGFPLSFQWFLNTASFEGSDKYKFDVSPLSVGDVGLFPGTVASFDVTFIGQANELSVSDTKLMCELRGGKTFVYTLKAGTSNLQAEVKPSAIDLGDCVFTAESKQTIHIVNKSPVDSSFAVSIPQECIPFITKINNTIVADAASLVPTWSFDLPAFATVELTLLIAPRVPGEFFVPLSIKIGFLDRIVVPIRASVYAEKATILLASGTRLERLSRDEAYYPWVSESIPPFAAFRKAAHAYLQYLKDAEDIPSTLDKDIAEDGTLCILGKTVHYDADSTSGSSSTKLNFAADELFLCYMENRRYRERSNWVLPRMMGTQLTATRTLKPKTSLARSRLLSPVHARNTLSKATAELVVTAAKDTVGGPELLNEQALLYIKDSSDYATRHVLFNTVVTFSPVIRGCTVSATVNIRNAGATAMQPLFDKRFLSSFNISVDPEKVGKVQAGDSVPVTVTFTCSHKAHLGDYVFVLPIEFKSSAFGFITFKGSVTLPTIRPVNLMACSDNFLVLPVKEKDYHILNFGRVYFGRARSFSLVLENPTSVPCNYSIDTTGGPVAPYDTMAGITPEVSVESPLSATNPNILSVDSSYGTLPPLSNSLTVQVTFIPQESSPDSKRSTGKRSPSPELGAGSRLRYLKTSSVNSLQSIYFHGTISFAVKYGGSNGSSSKVTVHVVGVGAHPDIRLSATSLDVAPIFPRLPPGSLTSVDIVNNTDEDWEVYSNDFDRLATAEYALHTSIARLRGSELARTKSSSKDTLETAQYAYLLDSIPAPGHRITDGLHNALKDTGLNSLVEWYAQNYVADKLGRDALHPQASDENASRTTPDSTNSSLDVAEDDDRTSAYLDCRIRQEDFSYNLCQSEETLMSYAKEASSVFDGRSYRITTTDRAISNIPFLVFLVHGAPLSGKSSVSSKLSSLFTLPDGRNAMPVLSLESLLCDTESYRAAHERVQEWTQAKERPTDSSTKQKRLGKTEPPAQEVHPMKTSEYLRAVADDLYRGIQGMLETNGCSDCAAGFVFDGLSCSAFLDIEDTVRTVTNVALRFMKPFVYPSQLYTSRLFLGSIILDCTPVDARKRSMAILVAEHKNAQEAKRNLLDALGEDRPAEEAHRKELDKCDFRMKIAKQALIEAKQKYDEELNAMSTVPVVDVVEDPDSPASTGYIQPCYRSICIQSDPQGLAHNAFLSSIPALNRALGEARAEISQAHRNAVDTYLQGDHAGNLSLSDAEVEYNAVRADLVKAEAELAATRKPQQKAIQERIDALHERLGELVKGLPPHPVEGILQENQFTCQYICNAASKPVYDDERFSDIFSQTALRFYNAFLKYTKVLTHKLKNVEAFSSARSSSGLGDMKEYLHIVAPSDFIVESVIKILAYVEALAVSSKGKQASEHLPPSEADKQSDTQKLSEAVSRQSTRSAAFLSSQKLPKGTKNAAAVKELLDGSPLLKDLYTMLTGSSAIAPDKLLGDLYAADFLDATVSKKVSRLVPLNNDLLLKRATAMRSAELLRAELESLNAQGAKGLSKHLQQQLAEKQAALSEAENTVASLLTGANLNNEVGAVRWRVPANSVMTLGLRYFSNAVTSKKYQLTYGVRGVHHTMGLTVFTKCDYPHIISDFNSLFSKHAVSSLHRLYSHPLPLEEYTALQLKQKEQRDRVLAKALPGITRSTSRLRQQEGIEPEPFKTVFTFGYLRAGLQRPAFFSTAELFFNPFQELADSKADRPSSTKRQVSPKARSDSHKETPTITVETCPLNNLSDLVQSSALKYLGDNVSQFIGQHVEVISIVNDGLFDATVAVFFNTNIPEPDVESLPVHADAAPSTHYDNAQIIEETFGRVWASTNSRLPISSILDVGANAAPSVKGSKQPARKVGRPVDTTFMCYPNRLVLRPGERSAVILTCFPEAQGEHQALLCIGVEHNPQHIFLDTMCKGEVPRIEYTLPECPFSLQPCRTQHTQIDDLMTSTVKALTGVAPAATKGTKLDPNAVSPYAKDILLVPRLPTGGSETIEIPVKNVSELPLYVSYHPLTSEPSLSASNAIFKFADLPLQESSTTDDFSSTYLTNMAIGDNVVVRNTHFLLRPGETQTLSVDFSSVDVTTAVLPGKLLVRQHYNTKDKRRADALRDGPASSPAIPHLAAVTDTFLRPVESRPLTICCESHRVDVFTTIASVPDTSDLIRKRPEHMMKIDTSKPSNHIILGVIRAEAEFQAEILLVNSGSYAIGYKASVAKSHATAVCILQEHASTDSPPAVQAKPKRGEAEAKPVFARVLSSTGVIAPAGSEAAAPRATRAGTQSQLSNVQKLIISFRAPTEMVYKRSSILSVSFYEPTTKEQLVTTSVVLSAEAVYSRLRIQPERNIVFSDYPHGSDVVRKVLLQNTGDFPLTVYVEDMLATVKRYALTGAASIFDETLPERLQNTLSKYSKLDMATLRQFGLVTERPDELLRLSEGQPGKAQSKSASLVPPVPLSLTVGAFTVSPYLFSLKPNESVELAVTFAARSTNTFKEFFTIDYTNRPPNVFGGSALTEAYSDSLLDRLRRDLEANALVKSSALNAFSHKFISEVLPTFKVIRYSVGGTSVVPGFLRKYEEIFEEQTMASTIPPDPSLLQGEPVFSPLAKTLCLGPCILGGTISERIKLLNPYSVPVTFLCMLNMDTSRMTQEDAPKVCTDVFGDTPSKVLACIKNATTGGTIPARVSSGKQQKAKSPSAARDRKAPASVAAVNDDDAWTLDTKYLKLQPREAQYLTISYTPSHLVNSRCQFIALSIDHFIACAARLQRPVSGKGSSAGLKPGDAAANEMRVLADLESSVTVADRSKRLLAFNIVAAGVMPEISFTPAAIDLGRIILNAPGSKGVARRIVSVKNTGRVPAKFALVVSAESQQLAECFCLQEFTPEQEQTEYGALSRRSSFAPQGNAFSGLQRIEPEEVAEFYIAPMYANMLHAIEGASTLSFTAVVSVKVMTGLEEFNVASAPITAVAMNTKLCAMDNKPHDPRHEQLLEDTLSILFSFMGSKQAQKQRVHSTMLALLYESKAFEQLRSTLLPLCAPLPINADMSSDVDSLVKSRATIFLKDLAVGTAPSTRPAASDVGGSPVPPSRSPPHDSLSNPDLTTEVELINTSPDHLRFEISPAVCKRLGIVVSPTVGHIHATGKKVIKIALAPPGDDQADMRQKGRGSGQTSNRTILFGTPLPIKYYPIMFEPGKRVSEWDNSMIKSGYTIAENGHAEYAEEIMPEPDYMVKVPEDSVVALYDELRTLSSGSPDTKQKLAGKTTGVGRLQVLQDVLDNIRSNDRRCTLVAEFLELNLFGVAASVGVKAYTKDEGSDSTTLSLLPFEAATSSDAPGLYLLRFSLAPCPILQKVKLDVYLANDGLASPFFRIQSTSVSVEQKFASPFAVDSSSGILSTRPDLLAAAVKETYPLITQNMAITALLSARLGLSAKASTDKAAQTSFLASVTALSTANAYINRYTVVYAPKVPGSDSEYMYSTCGDLQLYLTSTATLPVCHVDCPVSEYLQVSRAGSLPTPQRFAALVSTNPKAVSVLEITGQGVGVMVSGLVTVTNCINKPYSMSLQRLPESSPSIGTTFGQGGTLASGEQSRIRFDYTPTRESSKYPAEEAFYILRIPEHNITMPLLVVGHPVEPAVSSNTSRISFAPLMLGNMATREIRLLNSEPTPINFKVRRPANAALDPFQCIIVPNAGIILPHGSVTVAFTVKPTVEASINKIVHIDIPRRSLPININVKYEGYQTRHTLELLPSTEAGVTSVIGQRSELPFGSIFIADYRTRIYKLSNTGMHTLKFGTRMFLERKTGAARRDAIELEAALDAISMRIRTSEQDELLGDSSADEETHDAATNAVDKSEGKCLVRPGCHVFIELVFRPRAEIALTPEYKFTLGVAVEGAEEHLVRILGSGAKPGLRCNVEAIDFGSAVAGLLHERCATRSFALTNADSSPMNLEYLTRTSEFFVVTPPLTAALDPGKTITVDVRFVPNYAGAFKDSFCVTVNGLYKLRYPMCGMAVDPRLQITLPPSRTGPVSTPLHLSSTAPTQSYVSVPLGFNSVNAGAILRWALLRNTSGAGMTVRLQLNDNSSDTIPSGFFVALVPEEALTETIAQARDALPLWSTRKSKEKVIASMPKTILLKPNASYAALFMFCPTTRVPSFSIFADIVVEESIFFESCLKVTGAALGSSARILNGDVDMPPCLAGSSVQRDFMIENTGDIAVRFAVPLPPRGVIKRSLLSLFENRIVSITPVAGLIDPGATAVVTVRFSPQASGIFDLQPVPVDCEFDGVWTEIGAARVTLVCQDQQQLERDSTSEDISFSCAVRETTTRTVRAENNTGRTFNVRTVLDGPDARQYIVPERLIIPAGGVDFQITYRPLRQTRDSSQHTATLYVAGSDGGALIWHLSGSASAATDDMILTNLTEAAYFASLHEREDRGKGGKAIAPGRPGSAKQIDSPTSVPTDRLIALGVEATCHKVASLVFPVNNWEKSMQRFVVKFAFDRKEQAVQCNLSHAEFIDVPPAGTPRSLDVGFMPYIANTVYTGTLTLLVSETGESLQFRFHLASSGSPVFGKMAIRTPVRDPVSRMITIQNPLIGNKGITQIEYRPIVPVDVLQDVTVTPENMRFSNKMSTVSFKVEFNPLVPYSAEQSVTLQFAVSCNIDGVSMTEVAPVTYSLALTALIPRPSSPLKIQADAGTSVTATVSLLNRIRGSSDKTSYQLVLTGSRDITQVLQYIRGKVGDAGSGSTQKGAKTTVPSLVDNTTGFASINGFSLPSLEATTTNGQHFTVPTVFSPAKIGEYDATLVIYSNVGGFWVIPVVGRCLRPPASGAITME